MNVIIFLYNFSQNSNCLTYRKTFYGRKTFCGQREQAREAVRGHRGHAIWLSSPMQIRGGSTSPRLPILYPSPEEKISPED
jgi:hypothetical protein